MKSRPFATALILFVITGCTSGSGVIPQNPRPASNADRESDASTVTFSLLFGLPKSGPAHKVHSLTILPYASKDRPHVWNLNAAQCRAKHPCATRVRYRGNPIFIVRSYEKKSGAGKLLSTTVVNGAPYVDLTLVPSVAEAAIAVTDATPRYGKSEQIMLAGVGLDQSGDFIIGPAPYDHPIDLQVQGNMHISSTRVLSSVRPVSLSYAGGYEYAYIAVPGKLSSPAMPRSITVRPKLANAVERTTLLSPRAELAAASDGSVWLGDDGSCVLAKVNADLTTTPYPVPIGDSCPGDITTGPDGNVWFAPDDAPHVGRAWSGVVGYITPTGTITVYPSEGATGAIAAGPDGKLWIAGGLSGDIYSVTTTGIVAKAAYSMDSSTIQAIVAGPDGNLWIPYYTDSQHHGFDLISTAGTFVKAYSASAFAPMIVRGTDVYAITGSEPQLAVGEWDAEGRFSAKYETPDGLFSVSQFAIGRDGAVWYGTGETSTSALVLARVSSTGEYCELSVSVPTGAIAEGIDGLVSGGGGDLYYTRGQYGSTLGKITLPSIGESN